MPQPATSFPKRKRGQPRRIIPRVRNLPRISESAYAALTDYADRHGLYLADAIEIAAGQLASRDQRPPAFAAPLPTTPQHKNG